MNTKANIILVILFFVALAAYQTARWIGAPTASQLRARVGLVVPELLEKTPADIQKIEISSGKDRFTLDRGAGADRAWYVSANWNARTLATIKIPARSVPVSAASAKSTTRRNVAPAWRCRRLRVVKVMMIANPSANNGAPHGTPRSITTIVPVTNCASPSAEATINRRK